ncbi:MAG: DinB family protein [Chitinophagaceae bacterium]
MKTIAEELAKLIDQHRVALQAIPADKMSFKPSLLKWSRKEIIGHLVDSAQSNIRRFIVAQYEDTPHIVYNQDKWVAIAGYQQWDTNDLIILWYLLNKQIVAILKNSPEEMRERTCLTQDVHSLEWLAADYVKHLRHHLHMVLELENILYP